MGKTVTTYLIDGDPKGTQYAFISNKICQMFVIPRSNLAYLNEQEKLHKPAFYILIGEDEATKPQAYIGETENFKERVKDHDSKKTFWQKALVFVSKDEDMTKADVQYLEYRAIAEARLSNSFVLNENKQIPKAPNLPEHQRDAMDEFFEDIKFLASFIGCNIFEISRPKEEHLFYAKGRGCDAKGFYNSSGFTVLAGSVVPMIVCRRLSGRRNEGRCLRKMRAWRMAFGDCHQICDFRVPVRPQIFASGVSTTVGWFGKTRMEIH